MDAIKILGNLLGSNAMSSRLGQDLIGGLLKNAMGGGSPGSGYQTSGGLGDLLGSVFGSSTANPGAGGGLGGLGGLLGGVLGDSRNTSGTAGIAGGALGGLLMNALQQFGQRQAGVPATQATLPQYAPEEQLSTRQRQQANEEATVLIKAMISAAKADGQVDPGEQQNILKQLGDIDQEEMEFVRHQLAQPLDLDGLVASVPAGLEAQAYFMSLMTIKLDTQQELRYMQQLGQKLALPAEVCQQIHEQLGAPQIYS